MADPRQRLGKEGEELAASHLARRGYTILERNFRTRFGEIDLVARKDDFLVFVEVRTRRGRSFGIPEESITPNKREHLIAAAEEYLQIHDLADALWRIDLAAVELDRSGRLRRFQVIENAVSG